jgi:hypothetical protein
MTYLQTVPRYKFLIMDKYHPDPLYLREQGCEDPWLFFEAKKGSRAKKRLGKAALGNILFHNEYLMGGVV